jgi:hypothetical protein
MRGIYIPGKGIEIVDEEKNSEAFNKFKKLVVNILLNISQMKLNTSQMKSLSTDDIVNFVSDTISIVFRAPLILPLVPYEGNYLSNNFDYLVIYVLSRYYKNYPINDVNSLLKNLSEIKLHEIFRNNFYKNIGRFYEDIRLVYESLRFTPADMRPGMNFTSLASHMTLTSLVGWVKSQNSKDLPYLRLATLLQDIGKLKSPYNHVTEGEQFFNDIISELNKYPDAKMLVEELRKVSEQVRKYHSNVSVISDYDRIASSHDRILDQVRRLCESIEVCKPFLKCFEKGARADCMEEIRKELGNEFEEKYQKCSEEIYKNLQEQETEASTENSNGYIYYINFPGIQKFIKSFPSIKDMSTASFMVDFLVSTLPFIVLDTLYNEQNKTRLPLEALLVASGGHSWLVSRGDIKEEGDKFISTLNSIDVFDKLDVKLQIGYFPFIVGDKIISYGNIDKIISDAMLDSLIIKWNEKVYSYGFHAVCESCGIRPATIRDEKTEELLCERCYFIRCQSDERGIVSKLRSMYYINTETIKLPKTVKDAMVYIAGGTSDSKERTPYIGVMKFDGNDAGLFFKSKTFSEYIDKSFWVDYSVKKAFYTTLSNLLLREGIDDDLIARILAGVIFIGGDEGVIFAPSGLIIPFAIKFLKEAEKSLLKFKSGIIVAKPEHPVQMLFDAVNELMEKSKIKVNSGSLTSIGIIVTPGFITEQSLARELEQHKQILDVKMRLEDIQRILDYLTKPDYVDFTLNNEFLDLIIRELESALEEYFTHNNDVLHIVAYLMRERIKVNQEKKENAEALSDFILEVLKTFRKDGQEYGINLLGFYNVVKAFKVGLRES